MPRFLTSTGLFIIKSILVCPPWDKHHTPFHNLRGTNILAEAREGSDNKYFRHWSLSCCVLVDCMYDCGLYRRVELHAFRELPVLSLIHSLSRVSLESRPVAIFPSRLVQATQRGTVIAKKAPFIYTYFFLVLQQNEWCVISFTFPLHEMSNLRMVLMTHARDFATVHRTDYCLLLVRKKEHWLELLADLRGAYCEHLLF